MSEPAGGPGDAGPGDAKPGDAYDPGDADTQGLPGGDASEVVVQGEQGAEKAKRKRKRKRKRKSSAGDVEAPAGEGEAKRRESIAPFARYFAGTNPRRHAFAVGEVVAGRVQRVEDGAIVVDLFGKALAVADEFEPRDVPLPQEPEPETPEDADAQISGDVSASGEGAESGASRADDAATPQAAGAEAHAGDATEALADPAADPAAAGPQAGVPADAVVRAATGPQAGEASPEAVVPVSPVEAHKQAALEAEPATTAPEGVSQDGAQQVVGDVAAGEVADGPATELGAPSAESSQTPDGEATTSTADEPAGEAEASDQVLPEAPKGPVPVVPESFPRPELPTLGGIFKGRVGAVAESGHIVLLNRDVDRPAVRLALRAYREQRRRVEGLVFGYNRGGFDVLVEGLRAFCPASAMSLADIGDPGEYIGRKYEFLLPAGKGGKDVVVSRRSILERLARKRAKELVRSLQPGQRLSGKITSVREFGVFVDIGGIEGLVHQSELSHAFGVKPSAVANVGDVVEVKVLRIGDPPNRARKEGEKKERRDRTTRVSLSIRALLPDPWDAHSEAIAEGTVRDGKITRTTEFGAFVELAPDIEGLLHISELGRDLSHADQAVKEGDVLPVIVERADRKARRISLSRLTGGELEDYRAGKLDHAALQKNVRPGAKVTVRVDKADNRGVQVRLPGAIGRRARGFIPASETGTERGSDLRKRFPGGQELEVKVIGNDRDGGLKCSIKALRVDEERRAVKDYRREASKQGFGTFGDLLKAKLGE